MLDSIKQKLKQINPIKPTTYKKAGVLIILSRDNWEDGFNILFTKRSSKLSTHSGEVSFPGRMQEDIDVNLFETSLR